MEKVCIYCGLTKPTSDYYSHRLTADGFVGGCKECVRARARAARAARIDSHRERDRQRAFNPERVAARKANAERRKKDPALRTQDHATKKAWQAANNLKRRAHVIVGNGLKYGLIKKQPCERCATTEHIQAHHEDYRFPLAITWLCEPCHGLRHREINAARREGRAA